MANQESGSSGDIAKSAQPKKRKKVIIILIIAVILLLIILAGVIYYFAAIRNAASPTSESSGIPGWTAWTNGEGGIAFQHPPGTGVFTNRNGQLVPAGPNDRDIVIVGPAGQSGSGQTGGGQTGGGQTGGQTGGGQTGGGQTGGQSGNGTPAGSGTCSSCSAFQRWSCLES